MFFTSQVAEKLNNMGDAIDLTGDGGVMKKIVQRSKPDAIAPSESLPLVDGMGHSLLLTFYIKCLHSFCFVLSVCVVFTFSFTFRHILITVYLYGYKDNT